MTQQEFVERVRQLVGATEHEELEPSVLSVLRTLAEMFGDEGRPAFEGTLEHALGAVPAGLYGASKPARPSVFVARVCELTGLSHAHGRELTQAVCQALAESVPPRRSHRSSPTPLCPSGRSSRRLTRAGSPRTRWCTGL